MQMQTEYCRLARALNGHLVPHSNTAGREIKPKVGQHLANVTNLERGRTRRQNHVFQPQMSCFENGFKHGFNFQMTE